MSVAAAPTSGFPGEVPAATQAPLVDAACPLCGASLRPDQEWCLHCGAAARTRLAAPTNWKAPIVALALIATLALGVLAAALVELTGGPGTTTAVAPITTTITSPLATALTPTLSTATATTPGATPGGTSVPASPGAGSPGTPTTLTPPGSATATTPTATATSPTGAAPAKTGGTGTSDEEALRKAGFLPRRGK
ncbi:MAG TPA: hypothetical protein VES65_03365 [Solirubrobacteraceae bacterium]|nr:hypothetical protein [Solirubrobacteraceae bacterium]